MADVQEATVEDVGAGVVVVMVVVVVVVEVLPL